MFSHITQIGHGRKVSRRINWSCQGSPNLAISTNGSNSWSIWPRALRPMIGRRERSRGKSLPCRRWLKERQCACAKAKRRGAAGFGPESCSSSLELPPASDLVLSITDERLRWSDRCVRPHRSLLAGRLPHPWILCRHRARRLRILLIKGIRISAPNNFEACGRAA